MDSNGNPVYGSEVIEDKIREDRGEGRRPGLNLFSKFSWVLSILVLLGLWELAAWHFNNSLIMPTPASAFSALAKAAHDPGVLTDLGITLRRVGTGFGCALLIGLALGYLMGSSRAALRLLDPLLNSLRQIPIMAWVPLTIVWFGLGDGPTVFLITVSALFPILLNTIDGVQGISPDYYNAARSMGAGRLSIFAHVIVPGSLSHILTGARIGMGSGWMSVICAEFIATSAGFGHAMVRAQVMMETDVLMALMIMGAVVGFAIDRGMLLLSRAVIKWKPA
jgi:ABC-type nitrate/sulfonate/bicarbonate transport system permease component